MLGIGRGDSSLAHLGLAPAPVDVFARYVARLQGYLRGDDVAFDVADGRGELASSDALHLAGGPTASRLHWLGQHDKVPVDVAATGPRVIAVAARLADRVTFAVGADPARLRWAVHEARAANAAPPPMGAYLPVVVHADRARAWELATAARRRSPGSR